MNDRTQKLFRITVYAGLLLIVAIMLIAPSWIYDDRETDILLYVGIMALTVLSLLLAKRTVGSGFSRRVSRWVTALNLLVLALVAAVTFALVALARRLVGTTVMVTDERTGPLAVATFLLLALVVVVLWLFAMLRAARLRRWQLVFIPLGAMLLSILFGYLVLLGRMDDPDTLLSTILLIVLSAPLQLLPALLILPRKGESDQPNRASFLRQLRGQLWWQLPSREVQAVLADYNEFFENGRSEGKTEEALCAQFGDPYTIAQAVAEERGTRYYTGVLLGVLLGVGLLLLWVIVSFNSIWFTGSIPAPFLLDGALLALSALSVCFAAKLNTGGPRRRMACAVVGWLHLLPAVMVGLLLWMMFNIVPFLTFVESRFGSQHLGWQITGYTTVAALCLVALWFYNLLRTAAHSCWLLALIPLNALLLSLVAGLMQLLSTTDNLSRMPEFIGYILYKSLFQLIPLLLVPFVGRGRRHR